MSTDSYEYYFYRMLCGEVEAHVCDYFGIVTALDSTEESCRRTVYLCRGRVVAKNGVDLVVA